MAMSNIELYHALRVHLPEEAARLIADRLPHTEELATKSDIHALELSTKSDIRMLERSTKSDIRALELSTKGDIRELRLATEVQIQELRADIRGWMLTFFVPLWIGVYGTLAAVVVTLILRG